MEEGVAEQLEQALQRALVPHDVKEYRDAGHGFMNNHGWFFLKLLRFTGMGYNDPATMDARSRIVGFFHTQSLPLTTWLRANVSNRLSIVKGT